MKRGKVGVQSCIVEGGGVIVQRYIGGEGSQTVE